MPKFYGQNKKRVDPRYFLDEITDPIQDLGLVGVGKLTPQDRMRPEIKSQFDAINNDLPLTKSIVTGLLAIFAIPVTVVGASILAFAAAGVAIMIIISLEMLGYTEKFKFAEMPKSIDLVADWVAGVRSIVESDEDLKQRIKRKLLNDPAVQKITGVEPVIPDRQPE